MSKKDISEIKSSINQINTAISEIRESLIKALRDDNYRLRKRVKQLEVDLADSSQYQSRSNIIISGLSEDIVDVEPVVVKVLNKIDVPVSSSDIQAAHRVGRDRKKIIVRFVNPKHAEAALARVDQDFKT